MLAKDVSGVLLSLTSIEIDWSSTKGDIVMVLSLSSAAGSNFQWTSLGLLIENLGHPVNVIRTRLCLILGMRC